MADTPDVAPHLDLATVRAIVFGTRIARSVEIETPDIIVGVVRDRIWDNLRAFLAVGDWPDRLRSAEEIDADHG